MRAPAFWWREAGAAAALLQPLGALYGAVVERRLRQQGQRASVPVVCIGNLTLGGAGKTPTALTTARMLAASGERPVFLSRGYGGCLPGPVRVNPLMHHARHVGDEALLLAHAFPAIIARDRVAGGRAATLHDASVIVMDDGFQNPSLAKDCSILVIDARRGLGNGRIFPAGPLRGPLAIQIERADALVVIGAGDGASALLNTASRYDVALFTARLNADAAAVAELRPKKVLAFAGIGNPQKFFDTLTEQGIGAPIRRGFADHHRYAQAEAAQLLREAERHSLVPVTTEKDFARLDGDGAVAMLRARTKVLAVTLVIDQEQAFREFILRRIRGRA